MLNSPNLTGQICISLVPRLRERGVRSGELTISEPLSTAGAAEALKMGMRKIVNLGSIFSFGISELGGTAYKD